LLIPAVRRKWLRDAVTIGLLALMIAVSAWHFIGLGRIFWFFLVLCGLAAGVIYLFRLIVVPPVIREFGAFEIRSRSDDPEVWDVAKRTAHGMGIPMPRICIFSGHGAGAISWDFVSEKGVAVETVVAAAAQSGMLESCLAHEMAHIRNRDRLMSHTAGSLADASLAFALLLAASAVLNLAVFGYAPFSVQSLIVGLVILAFDRLLLMRLLGWMMRQHEFAADALGVAVTGNPLAAAATLMAVDLRARQIERDFREAGAKFGHEAGPDTHPDTGERVRALISGRQP